MNALPLVLVLGLSLGQPPEGTQVHDFRADSLPPGFRPANKGMEKYLKSGPDGLTIKLPVEKEAMPAVGVVTQPTLTGDFEITVRVVVVHSETPGNGYGSGAALYLQTSTMPRSFASLSRFNTADGKTVYKTNCTKAVKGENDVLMNSFPAGDATVWLRVTRTGDRLTFSVAEKKDATFRGLGFADFGTAPVNWVQISANPGGARTPVEVTVTDLRIRANPAKN